MTTIFSFSHNVFQKASFLGSLKVGIVWYRVNGPEFRKVYVRPYLKYHTKFQAHVIYGCIEHEHRMQVPMLGYGVLDRG